jgi:D-serine deaminase-like pyridoxal phosphate-dependent protein
MPHRLDVWIADQADQPLGPTQALPTEAEGMTVEQIRGRGWRVDDLPTPVAVLDRSAVGRNLRLMRDWCAARGIRHMPHGKTTMAPALFAAQLAHGVDGIVAATPGQVRTMWEVGVEHVGLANELTQRPAADRLAARLADGGVSFWCWVDSVDGVQILERAATSAGVVFEVMVEVGVVGGRAGCRTVQECREVASAVAGAEHVRLIGVAGYEGAVAGHRTPQSLRAVRDFLRLQRSVAETLRDDGLFDGEGPWLLTAGGSEFFDLVVEEFDGTTGFETLIRSGCYLAHDHGMFAETSPSLDWPEPFHAALTVWGTVLSRHEDTAYLDVGRRDVSFDQGLPRPLLRRRGGAQDAPLDGAQVTQLNDQHAFVRIPDGVDVRVGDRVQLGISHPCTTFDKHRVIPVVEQGVVVDAVTTLFA